jgi:hypothetical protein
MTPLRGACSTQSKLASAGVTSREWNAGSAPEWTSRRAAFSASLITGRGLNSHEGGRRRVNVTYLNYTPVFVSLLRSEPQDCDDVVVDAVRDM